MDPLASAKSWIETQRDRMIGLVERWAVVNSGTMNSSGVGTVAHLMQHEFAELGVTPELIPVDPVEELNNRGELVAHELGPALSIRCRPEAPRRVLLVIHMDTVYGIESPFQTVRRDDVHLYGPGVADAKGGVAVMLVALQALERHVESSGIRELGWEVLLNPDEEIGSPGSARLLEEASRRNHVGLLFEPALPDGSLAHHRKGSANFHIRCVGVSAHAGRHFEDGRNAVAAAAFIASGIHQLNGDWEGTTLNVARIDGGGPLNMVPSMAVLRFNVRYSKSENEPAIAAALDELQQQASRQFGVDVERFGEFNTPPKTIDDRGQFLFDQIRETAKSLEIDLNWRSTGGVCDGNRLAGWGVPNVDTLGVRGGGIHSTDEFMVLDSLTERATLTAHTLINWTLNSDLWPCPSLPS
ncbi:hydrolase [Thalassoglobus neptunius]|nr:hydrolase [Thalassoglobus neptunius]